MTEDGELEISKTNHETDYVEVKSIDNLLRIKLQEIYKIDWGKVEDIEDVKEILKGLGITFTEETPGFEHFEPYKKEVSTCSTPDT